MSLFNQPNLDAGNVRLSTTLSRSVSRRQFLYPLNGELLHLDSNIAQILTGELCVQRQMKFILIRPSSNT